MDPWTPSSYVTYNTGSEVYEIDEDFALTLQSESFRQLGIDSARLEVITGSGSNSGYFKIVSVASGDLADELGLQTNDVLKSIDGYDLGTLEDRLDAYVALKDETEFLLTIDRSGTVRLSYEIVD